MTGSGTTPPPDNPDWYDGDVCWVTTSELRETVITDTEKTISQEALKSFSALKVFPEGALAIAMYGATIGRLGIFGIAAATNQACGVLFGQKAFDTKFVFYWLQAFREQIILLASGGGQPNISQEKVRSVRIACPSIDEQQTIARFLDAKTAQIDALVAQKQQLIAKLKEKRSTLIARTVTRGLPPEAAKVAGLEPHPEMKDSGVEWLGAIPTHWATPPLYARYSVELGKMLSEAKITGEHLIPYLRNVDVQWNVINYQDLPEMDIPPAEYPRYTICTGDLLVCEGGEVGRAAIVGKFDGVIGYQKALHRLRALRDDEDQRFMCFILEWAAQTGVFNAGGMSTIAHLTGEQLRKYRFPKPPKNEQQVIVQYLQREIDKIAQLQREVETAIDRLTEYRQALITSAVTGQIDVRALA
jgi:type I restriction enzyme S subunit